MNKLQMKKNLYVYILIVALLLFAVPGVFAQQAVIRELAGTVELKQAGSTAWTAASRGATLSGDTVISTGFKSTALIAVGDSLITVRPLTRLSLSELSRTQNIETVTLNLQTGRVRAEVKAAEGSRTDFTVRSSAATASVRGTVFEFDTYNLSVNEGTVEFNGSAGNPVLVDAGGMSFLNDRTGQAAPPDEVFITELRPELPLGAESVQTPEKVADTGAGVTIVVTITF